MTDADYMNSLLEGLEASLNAAAAFGGIRQQFIDVGFTPEQAGDLVVALFRQNAKADD